MGSFIDNEKAYETFKGTTAAKYANSMKKVRKVAKTFPKT